MIQAFNSDPHEEAAAALLGDGAVIVRQAASPKLVSAFRAALRELIEEDEARWGENHPFPGIVHLLPARRKVFLEYVKLPGVLGPMRKILGRGCIASATNGSSVPPNRPNYAREIHVDVPRFIDGYVGMLSCLLALHANHARQLQEPRQAFAR